MNMINMEEDKFCIHLIHHRTLLYKGSSKRCLLVIKDCNLDKLTPMNKLNKDVGIYDILSPQNHNNLTGNNNLSQ